MRRRRRRWGTRALARALVDPRLPKVRRALVEWGNDHGRSFFWRLPNPSAYSILIAESLLSKTRAEVVEPVALQLLAKYATPTNLATARRPELQKLLRPLGLHRKRAKQLISCARAIVAEHEGDVPDTVASLMALPSIGRYAANAIALVAFDQHVSVVDANVVRVYRRVFSLPKPPDRLSSADALWDFAKRLLPRKTPREFTWALLDLGGTVCVPRKPQCAACPVFRHCDFARQRR